MLTLSIRFNKTFVGIKNDERYMKLLNSMFDHFCCSIEKCTGRKLQYLRGSKYYVPGYGIHFTEPSPKWGWGRIYLQPTKHRLECLQEWLQNAFGEDMDEISIKLKWIELAYDYHCPNLSFEEHELLVLRVAASLVPQYSSNTFVAAVIGKRKHCNDGAINGAVTAYIQNCPKKDKSKEADKLNRNEKSVNHTKIYAKELQRRPFLRVENKINAAKAKRLGIELDQYNLSALMNLPKLPFSKLWQFRTTKIDSFIKAMEPINSLRNVRRHIFANILRESANMPAADRIRLMKAAAKGNEKLAKKVEKRTPIISFERAINTTLPVDFYISQRMGKHALPDDSELPKQITLQPFIHEAITGVPEPKKPEAKPVQLPLAEQAADSQESLKMAFQRRFFAKCNRFIISTKNTQETARKRMAKYGKWEGVP